MDGWRRLAEQRIEDAIAAGHLDNLPGKGRPLQLADLSRVPDNVRGAYLLMRGSGHLPPEMELRKEMLQLKDLLAACQDPTEAESLRQRLTQQRLRYELLMQDRGLTPAYAEYQAAVHNRLAGA